MNGGSSGSLRIECFILVCFRNSWIDAVATSFLKHNINHFLSFLKRTINHFPFLTSHQIPPLLPLHFIPDCRQAMRDKKSDQQSPCPILPKSTPVCLRTHACIICTRWKACTRVSDTPSCCGVTKDSLSTIHICLYKSPLIDWLITIKQILHEFTSSNNNILQLAQKYVWASQSIPCAPPADPDPPNPMHT